MRLADYLGSVFAPAKQLFIDESQRKRLTFLAKAGKTPQVLAMRARIILLAAEGKPNSAIGRSLGISRPTVLLWRGRFARFGVPGLTREARRSGRPRSLTPERVKEVVEATINTKPVAATQWSVRTFAKAHGLKRDMVHRIWRQHRLQPHRVETFKFSNDKHFVEKLRDIVGLYMNPPDHALVLCYDEKTQIQALDRTQPGLPLKKGRCTTMTHDYKRHGTTTLFAALNVLDGKVIGECRPRHRSEDFVRFLNRIDRETSRDLNEYLANNNAAPKAFTWTKDADTILAKIERCKASARASK